jgi:hypothetical protein
METDALTVLTSVVSLLILGQEHIVAHASPHDSTLRSHGMALAGQASGAHEAVGQRDTTLLLDVHRPLELPRLRLGLLLLPLGRGRVAVVGGLSLLVFGALTARGFGRNAAVAGLSQGVALGLSGFLFLLEFRLLLHQALSDVVHARRFVKRLLAELALDLGGGGFERVAGRQTEADSRVHGRHKRAHACASWRCREGIGKIGALLGRLAVPATGVGRQSHGLTPDGDLDGLDGDDLSALGGKQLLVHLAVDDGILGERVASRLTAGRGLAKGGGGRHGEGMAEQTIGRRKDA